MSNIEPQHVMLKPVARVASASIKAVSGSLIKTNSTAFADGLPLLVEPVIGGIDLHSWASTNRSLIDEWMRKHGAVLFRDFGLHSNEDFGRAARSISGDLMEYKERSSPRTLVAGRIYTSTDYPAEQAIFPHNEHSYSLTFPLKLYFFCATPPAAGGETPLANTRRIFQRIDPAIRRRFEDQGWMYVRNFWEGIGVSWRAAFGTDDKSVVEEYCRKGGIECEWRDGGRLRTRQVRRTHAAHPLTAEMVWFNHATFFHISTLEATVQDQLLRDFAEEDLPNNTYYGDGSPIAPGVMEELRAAYLAETVTFPWKRGDLLVIDNMLTSHARRPFTPPREILVAMAEPYDWCKL